MIVTGGYNSIWIWSPITNLILMKTHLRLYLHRYILKTIKTHILTELELLSFAGLDRIIAPV